jgi:two-component system sensor histidine kinase BaeS
MKLKLIHKLLIAMFTSTALVAVLIILVTRASIGRGFVDFLQQQEHAKVLQVAPAMASWYDENGSWDALTENPRLFHELVFSALPREPGFGAEFGPGPEGRRPPARDGRRAAGPRSGQRQQREPGFRGGPGPGGFNGLPQRIFLLNAEKYALIGRVSEGTEDDQLIPIEVAGVVAGYLGVTTLRGIELPEEEAFITRLRDNLLVGLGIGLAVAALLAWLLARHLSRPVNEVAGGIHALAAGDYSHRLKTPGSDEIARLGDDVNRLASALGEHESARKRWMTDMAHELRTPLAIISGELEAMADGVRPLDQVQLGSVQDEVRHLSALVDDLHSLALTDSGALAYKMDKVDLDELVQLACESFQGPSAQKDLALVYQNPGQRREINGDEQRLRQLLRNLVDNAIRYTDAGGQITITLTADHKTACFTISDTAPGASPQECERLFDRLYRLEGSRNRNSGGSGLGLAICRNIVEAHGGEIRAEPGPDGGLLITTTLPMAS